MAFVKSDCWVIMNSELGSMRMKWLWSSVRVCPCQCLEILRKAMIILSQDSLSMGWDLKLGLASMEQECWPMHYDWYVHNGHATFRTLYKTIWKYIDCKLWRSFVYSRSENWLYDSWQSFQQANIQGEQNCWMSSKITVCLTFYGLHSYPYVHALSAVEGFKYAGVVSKFVCSVLWN